MLQSVDGYMDKVYYLQKQLTQRMVELQAFIDYPFADYTGNYTLSRLC
jgi:hypothetical protein